MGESVFACQLIELASCLRREQLWHDDVCEIWRNQIGKGVPPAEQAKANELLKQAKETRTRRADQLRKGTERAPPKIVADLHELANRLETTADDVSDTLVELAASINADVDCR